MRQIDAMPPLAEVRGLSDEVRRLFDDLDRARTLDRRLLPGVFSPTLDAQETAEAVEVLQAFQHDLGSARGDSAPPPAAAAPTPSPPAVQHPDAVASPQKGALPTPPSQVKRGCLLTLLLLGLAPIVVLYALSH